MAMKSYKILVGDTTNGDHYLRLGAYNASSDSVFTDSQEEGILLYASGMYTLKVDGKTYEEVGNRLNREVSNGDTTYKCIKENNPSGGNCKLKVANGGVTISAKNDITFLSNRDDSTTADADKETTVLVEATGGHDVTFRQGDYLKETSADLYEEVNAHRHKTNLSLAVKQQVGVYTSTFIGIKLSYKTFAVKTYLYSIGASTISVGFGVSASKFILVSTVGFTFFYLKKVFTDFEMCVVKNEYKLHKFENKAIGHSFKAGLRVSLSTAYKDRKQLFAARCKFLEVMI